MVSTPKVSVVIPCYNADATITQTLDSVLAQSFQGFVVVAVNDGSRDGTRAILEEYSQRYPDKIKVITQENQGQTVAKNVGIRQSKSDYIAFLDSDDLWAPNKLTEQISLLNARPEVGLCYTTATLIDEGGQKTGSASFSAALRGRCQPALINGNNIVASSVMVRRVAVEQVECYDEAFRACENWDLWIRVAGSWEIEAIDESLTSYRVHAQNMSKDIEKMLAARLRVVNKHLPAESTDSALLAQRREALFKTHLAFTKSYIETLNLGAARGQLIAALQVKPMARECYLLYLKTLLGKQFFQWIRQRRARNL